MSTVGPRAGSSPTTRDDSSSSSSQGHNGSYPRNRPPSGGLWILPYPRRSPPPPRRPGPSTTGKYVGLLVFLAGLSIRPLVGPGWSGWWSVNHHPYEEVSSSSSIHETQLADQPPPPHHHHHHRFEHRLSETAEDPDDDANDHEEEEEEDDDHDLLLVPPATATTTTTTCHSSGPPPGPHREDADRTTHPNPFHILSYYAQPFNLTAWQEGTLHHDHHEHASRPLSNPAAAAEPLSLQLWTFPQVRSCSQLPGQWPVNSQMLPLMRQDPFTLWIHDVFPVQQGQFVQIVAQNYRRCHENTAPYEAQAALFQHVSVQRVIIPGVNQTTPGSSPVRYRLVPHHLADPDGLATRFICRFQPTLEETLSVYNYDYDWLAFRRGFYQTFQRQQSDLQALHLAQLTFMCPVPQHLQEAVYKGSPSAPPDWTNLFVDIVPLRTAPRFGRSNQYFPPWYQAHLVKNARHRFDPRRAWGPHDSIWPALEDSGRWENIPLCPAHSIPTLNHHSSAVSRRTGQHPRAESSPVQPDTPTSGNSLDMIPNNETSHAPPPPTEPLRYRLIGCLWASAKYSSTVATGAVIDDSPRRLLEWLTHSQLIGFDHIYLYDNSYGFKYNVSLKPIAQLFPDYVTHIPWPSKLCRQVGPYRQYQSQFAAEASCRLRFGPQADWIGQFDIDEYFIPMGNFTTARQLLDQLDQEDIKIISFWSYPALLRQDRIEPPNNAMIDPVVCEHPTATCFQPRVPPNVTYLQAYNCEVAKVGERLYAFPAEKQFYKPSYVLQHLVHYSLVTETTLKNRSEYEKDGFLWKLKASPDPRERFSDEANEGFMIHAKSLTTRDTVGWDQVCRGRDLRRDLVTNTSIRCNLGTPWPSSDKVAERAANATADGWLYNCFENRVVEQYFAPRLSTALRQHACVLEELAT